MRGGGWRRLTVASRPNARFIPRARSTVPRWDRLCPLRAMGRFAGGPYRRLPLRTSARTASSCRVLPGPGRPSVACAEDRVRQVPMVPNLRQAWERCPPCGTHQVREIAQTSVLQLAVGIPRDATAPPPARVVSSSRAPRGPAGHQFPYLLADRPEHGARSCRARPTWPRSPRSRTRWPSEPCSSWWRASRSRWSRSTRGPSGSPVVSPQGRLIATRGTPLRTKHMRRNGVLLGRGERTQASDTTPSATLVGRTLALAAVAGVS